MKNLLFIVLMTFSISSWGYGVGQSTYPMLVDQKIISTEFTGLMSNGSGIGLQGRFTYKLNKTTYLDAGAGLGSGDRSNRIFAGADYEVLPDYDSQPKVSVKFSLENAKEFTSRKNILSLTPIASKGFSFWGKEAYPYVALPFSLNLDGANNTYQSSARLAFGASAKLPFDGYKHLTGNVEGSFSVKDSYSAVFMAVSYPLN